MTKHRNPLVWLVCATFSAAAVAASDACSSIAISSFLSLSNFGPAHMYCSERYPHAPSATVPTSCSPNLTAASKRDQRYRHRGFDYGHHIPPHPMAGPEDGLFANLLHEDAGTISTFCSCIAPPQQQTGPISCAQGEYCDPSGVCKIQRDCQNPARCDVSSFCGRGSAGGLLFCHQDTDVDGMGYCMNDGPPGAGCPQQYEDCSSNAECGGQRICIYSCCREAPFCIDVADYKDKSALPPPRPVNATNG